MRQIEKKKGTANDGADKNHHEEEGKAGGGELKEFLCHVLKFWSGKFLHLLLWDGSDSVISMIGLNPGRVKKTE